MSVPMLDSSYVLQQFLQDTMADAQNQATTPTDIGSLMSAVGQAPALTNTGTGSTSDSVAISLEAQMLQQTTTSTTSPILAALTNTSSPNSDNVSSLSSLTQQLTSALPPELFATIEQKLRAAQTQGQPASTTASNSPQSVNATV